MQGEGGQHSGTGSGARRKPCRGRARWAVLCVLVASLSTCGATAQAALVHPFNSQLTGRGGEPFSSILCGVNIDPASGEVYVADPGAEIKIKEEERPAIDVFSSAGAFLGKIDKGASAEFKLHEACSTSVNDTTHHVYVANAGEGEGAEEGEKAAVFVYAPTLVVGKFKFEKKLTIDGSNTPAKTFEARNQAGELEAGGPLHVAVDNSTSDEKTGNVYVAVAEQGVIDQFNAGGEYLTQLRLPVGSRPQHLATDSSGDLFAVVDLSEEGFQVEVIDEFNPAGLLIKQITGSSSGGFGQLTGVAVDAAGHIYASDGATLAVDEFDSAGRFMGQITGSGSGTPGGSFAEPAGVAVNAEGDVYVADRTGRRRAGSGVIDILGPATPGAPPFLENEWASGVTSTSATLEAQIDPTGSDTTYHFEYAPEGGAFEPVPKADVDLGSGEAIVRVEAHLQGLLASTTYQFRVVVHAAGHAVEEGALKTFTTPPEGVVSGLPDGRAFELVSPPNKLGALIKGIGAFGVVQAAADGTRIAYSATSPIEPNAPANASEAPVLSVRGAESWSSREIMPPDYPSTGIGSLGTKGLENRAFSLDLTRSLVDPFKEEPLLSEEASERTPYLRDLNDVPCRITETTCYTPLVTKKGAFANDTSEVSFGGPPAGSNGTFGEVLVIGATPDLSHVVLKSQVPLKAGLEGKGLYQWTAGKPPAEQLALVSVLPTGKPALATEAAGLGIFKTGKENVRHAISGDGSRIVWSTTASASPKHLYVRDMAKGETIQLDTPEEGVIPEGESNPIFQTASANGSTVFFTDEQNLTKHSTASEGHSDLYACQIEPQGGSEGKLACKLKDLTDSEVVKHPGERASVQGLLPGASEDGSYVYFVADGVLGSGENAQKEKATPGSCGEHPPLGATCGLYVEHYNGESASWEEPTFIAALSSDDGPDWGALATEAPAGRLEQGDAIQLQRLTSRVSPNGKYLAFMSDRRLTGFDNADTSKAAAGAPDEEVFLYGVSANRVVCASCNRYGQRPHGVFDSGHGAGELVVDRQENWTGRWLAANVPGWTELNKETALTQSRYLSNSGRLFFNSADALVAADTNLTEDVYQYEPEGVGSCAVASGCVALISSGKSQEESAFIDASENGGDVFFLTAAKLLPQDFDQSVDVYDAHECTSESPCLAPPVPRPPCDSSTSCQGASSQQTGFGAPASATLAGSGNLVQSQGALPVRILKLTRKQQLERALKACRKLKHKTARMACTRKARKKFGAKKASSHARKSGAHSGRGSR